MKHFRAEKRGFWCILLLIIFAAAAFFGGMSLTDEHKTKTAYADTTLTAAEISSIGYEYRMYTFSGSTFWNGYGVGSTNDREPMLYHTGTGNLLCWSRYAPAQTTSFTGLAFRTISSGGSFSPCAGSTVGYSSANTTGAYSVYLYGPFSGNPAWGSVNTTPVLYRDSGGYVYCIIEGITYYLTKTGTATTSKSSATPLMLTNVPSQAQTMVTSPVTLTYTGSSQTHPGASAYASYFSFAGTPIATAAGTYTYYVTPKSGYAWSDGTTGTKTVTWTIAAADASNAAVTVNGTAAYDPNGATPSDGITVKLGGKTLTAGTDYTVTYQNNTGDAGSTATALVTFKGNYKGTATATYTITKATGALDGLSSAPTKVAALGGTGSLSATGNSSGEISYSFSDPDVVNVSGSGSSATLTGGNKLGAATVTVTLAETNNYTSATQEIQVSNCLDNGFYIVGADGEKYAYSDLGAAYAALSGTTDKTIYVVGNPTVDEPLTIADGESVTIAKGDNAVSMTEPNMPVISRASGFTGSIFRVEGGGSLTVEGVTVDGEGTAGDPLITSAGALYIGDDTTIQNGNSTNGGAVSVVGGTVTVGSGATFSANAAKNGGAIYVADGTLTVEAGAAFTANTAENGGAIYIAGGDAALSGAYMGNKASGDGGAVYVAASVTDGNVSVGAAATITNNAAGGTGDGIETDGVSISVAGNATGVTDGIGISGAGQIVLTGTEITGSFTVDFADPATQTAPTVPDNKYLIDYTNENTKQYVVAESKDITNGALNASVTVQNGGYVFDYDKKEEDPVPGLCLKKSIVNVVAYKDPVSGEITYFSSIKEAIGFVKDQVADSTGTLYFLQHEKENEGVKSYSHIEISLPMTIPDGVNLTFESAVMVPTGEIDNETNEAKEDIRFLSTNGEGKLVDAEGNEYSPTVIKRAESLTGALLTVERGGTLTIGNVTFDGGAEWEGGSVQITDDGNGGAGTVTTNNTGITAHAPVIVNRGTLTIEDGATIQNNDNNYAAPGEGFGSQNYGGGVRNEGAGTLTMTGGVIQNCYSREGGAIMNVNKPGTEGYVAPEEGGGPEVTVSGGAITGNVSQQKGAAIQTIYGGATTTVTQNANIAQNRSLNDLGVLSVEEGGSLTVSGGTVSAESGTNAIYLYNKYGAEDYEGATTKPFIEGAGAGELTVSGAPVLTGNVHIDGACTVVNTVGTEYEPFVDIRGYTGSNPITVDLSEGAAYGKVAVNSANDFSKLVIDLPDNGLGKDFTYTVRNEDGSYMLMTSGYRLEVGQTESGKLTVTGVCDPAIESFTLTVGGKTHTVSRENGDIGANGEVSFTLDLTELDGTEFAAAVAVTVNGVSVTTDDDLALKVLKFDPLTGKITAPAGTTYRSSDGRELPLTTGTLPNDIAIDEAGNVTVRVDGTERTVFVGLRTDAVAGDVLTELGNNGDTTLQVQVGEEFSDLEYNLVYTDGDGNKVLVSDVWKKPDENGYITYEGLSDGVAYTVVVRNPAQTDEQGNVISVPGEYKECKDSTDNTDAAYTTLTGAEQAAKEAFETKYADIEGKLLGEDGNGDPVEPTATAAEIKALIDDSENLADGVQSLRSFKMKIARLNQSYDHALANEWKADNTKVIGTVSAEGYNGAFGDFNGDGTEDEKDAALYREALVNAIGGYEAEDFTAGARELVADEYADLIAAYKLFVQNQLDGVLEQGVQAGADRESLKAIVDGYKINVADALSMADVDALYEKAQLAAELRTEYDKIVKESGSVMTEQSRTELNELLVQALEDVRNAVGSENLQAVSTAATVRLHRKQAEGMLVYRYGQIEADYESGESGIVNDSRKEEIKRVYDEQLDGILNAADDTDFAAAAAAAVLALDRAEGKAILNDYLRAGDEDATKAIVTAPENGANAEIDRAADKNAIDAVVAGAKKDIAVARIRAAIGNMQSELAAAGNTDEAIAERMNGKSDDDADTGVYGILGDLNGNGGAQAAICGADFEGDPAAYADAKIAEAETYLSEFDRKQFTAAHAEILGKSVAEITGADIAAIDAALNDLADNYVVSSQDGMNDLRDDLLAKKKAAIVAALGEENGAELQTVGNVLNDYIGKINAVNTDGGTLSDEEANRALDLLWQKAQAAADYLESCYYINGAEADVNGETASGVLGAIDGAADLAAVNAALEDGVLTELDGILHRDENGTLKDSSESESGAASSTEGLVNAVKDAVQQAVVAANGDHAVADLSDRVQSIRSDVEAQRAAEKTAAKNEIKDAVSQSVAELSEAGREKAEQLIAAAEQAIDGGDFVDYPLIVSRIKAKICVLAEVDALMQTAAEEGITDVSALTQAAEEIYREIDAITDRDALDGYGSQIPADVILDLQKGYAVAELERFAEDGDLQTVSGLLADATAQIGEADGKAAIDAIVAATKAAMTGERFIDGNPVLQKNFPTIDGNDLSALEAAKAAYDALPDAVKSYLNDEYRGDYDSFGGLMEDATKKAEFESHKADAVAELARLADEQGGELVDSAYEEQLAQLNGVVYEAYHSDEGRGDYAQGKSDELDAALGLAKEETQFAQEKQRAVNGAVQFMQDLLANDSYEYGKEQADYLQEIVDRFTDELKNVTDATEDGRAAIEDLLNDAKEQLGNAPVTSVIKGNLASSDSSADYGEDHDGTEIWGIVTNDSGIDGGVVLVIEKVDEEREQQIKTALTEGSTVVAEGSNLAEDELSGLLEGKEVKSTVDIYLLKNNVKITRFNGMYIVKILLDSELRSASGLQVVYLDDDGSVQVYETHVEEGKYLVFTTAHFSEFIILGEPELNLWWLIVTLSVLFAIELIAIAGVLIKRKKQNGQTEKTCAFAPVLSLLTVIIPNGAVTACIALAVCIAVAGGALAVLAFKKKHSEEQAAPDGEPAEADEARIVEDHAEIAAAATAVTTVAAVAAVAAVEEAAEEEVCTVYDSVTQRHIVIKYSRSFLSKLIQSDDETKRYYEELKNEIMSYGVKSRVSWRHESFRKGRTLLIKMQMRGKTLCLCFALTASDYAESKYKVEDLSEVAALAGTPCLYRIKNERRCRYAKDLIADVMTKYGLERGEEQSVPYARDLPYEETEALIAKGLIRELTDEEAQSGTQFRPVEVRDKVRATEVDDILSDDEAKSRVESTARYADKTKTGIVNVDTLSRYFGNGETVTLEELKKRVPGFTGKITYVKVLARGTLDKSLTVEADDFSIEAVKMILLTGGKVVRTLVRTDK